MTWTSPQRSENLALRQRRSRWGQMAMAEERLREGTAAPQLHPCVTAITPGRTRGGTTRCAGGWSTWWITTAAGTGSSAWCARPLWPRWRSAPSRGTSIRCTPTLWSTALRKSSRWCWATTRQPCSWPTRTTASCPQTTGRSSWLRSRHTLALRKGLSPVSPPCLKNNPPPSSPNLWLCPHRFSEWVQRVIT